MTTKTKGDLGRAKFHRLRPTVMHPDPDGTRIVRARSVGALAITCAVADTHDIGIAGCAGPMGDQVSTRYLIRYQTQIGEYTKSDAGRIPKRPYTGTAALGMGSKNKGSLPPHPLQRSGQTRNGHLPHALQILLPTSSLRHNGVVLVPQFAQLRAPTALRPLARLFPGVWALMTGEDSAPDVSAAGSAALAPSAFWGVCPLAGSTNPA